MYRLRVKTPNGTSLSLNDKLNGESTLLELRNELYNLTSIPVHSQKILKGFPPQQITGSNSDKLDSFGLKNGEVIIVEDLKISEPKIQDDCERVHPTIEPTQSEEAAWGSFPKGFLMKRVVPSDNSCLFASVYYLMNGGASDLTSHSVLRAITADLISKQPELYNEGILEKTNADYCKWILKGTSWGGAIELAILCDYYLTEIVALDVKSGLVNRFGEDKQYSQRIIVMYDGIHYDPVHLETYDGRIMYIFPTREDWILQDAQLMVLEAKNTGQFTDVNKFKIKCLECGIVISGEQLAVVHAKETGHQKFDEIHPQSNI